MAEATSCSENVRHGSDPGEACMKAAATHVAHDLDLLQLAWESRNLRVGWTLWFIMARSLMDFFFCYERKEVRKEYKDDVLAADFLAPGVWKPLAEGLKKPLGYSVVREAANKLSAHLTYSRVDLRESGGVPPSAEVHEFLLGTAAVWLDELEPGRRVWFGRELPCGSRAS
jgi:hypothetical protein